LPTSERIATTGADRAVVTAGHKAAWRKNVLKRASAVSAHLQQTAVKAVLQVEVIPKGYFYRLAAFDQKNTW